MHQEIDAALAMLQRGRAIVLQHEGLAVAFLSAEFAGREAIEQFAGGKPLRMLVTAERARVLGLAGNMNGGGTVVFELQGLSEEDARILSNPLLDRYSLVRPSNVRSPSVEAIANCAMRLAKTAELLPALLYRYAVPGEGPALDVRQVQLYSPPEGLQLVATAPLPVDVASQAQIYVFREEAGGANHVALQLGHVDADTIPLVRIHSECFTGDVLSSRKCDCGAQLDSAKRKIAQTGGFLIYLREEGRGIGLMNKIRAYALQHRGLDTVDANLHVGYADDERTYLVAAEILKRLGVTQVRLITNNPSKAEALRAAGILVSECRPLRVGRNRHNRAYLDTKRDRSGHRL